MYSEIEERNMPWDYLLTGATGAGIAVIVFFVFLKRLIEGGVETALQARLEQTKSELGRETDRLKAELDVWGTLRKNLIAEVWKAHEGTVKSMANVLAAVQEPFALVEFSSMDETLKDPKARVSMAESLAQALNSFRRLSHENVHLISDEGGKIAQDFFDIGYKVYQFLTQSNVAQLQQPPASPRAPSNLQKSLESSATDSSAFAILQDEMKQNAGTYQFLDLIQGLKAQRKLFYGYISDTFGVSEAMPWMAPIKK
jgi:hypothetical protein